MKEFDPKGADWRENYKLLSAAVAPRPIALVSTISAKGEINLSPFSFFNVFGANPPIVAFSPLRRGRDGSLKDTCQFISETGECVIQVVTYSMVEQVNLASTEYKTGINEFIKSGLTPLDAKKVKAKRVAESPFQMECVLMEILPLGEGGGAGNLIICEVVYFHVAEDIFREGLIQPELIDLVGRNGANYYTRTNGTSLFEVAKPIGKKCIGYEQLPQFIKESHVFSANNLAKLANAETIPTEEDVRSFIDKIQVLEGSEQTWQRYASQNDYQNLLRITLYLSEKGNKKTGFFLETTAKIALEKNNNDFAWKTILYRGLISEIK